MTKSFCDTILLSFDPGLSLGTLRYIFCVRRYISTIRTRRSKTEHLRSYKQTHLISDSLAGWHCNIRTSDEAGEREKGSIRTPILVANKIMCGLEGRGESSSMQGDGTLYKYFVLLQSS